MRAFFKLFITHTIISVFVGCLWVMSVRSLNDVGLVLVLQTGGPAGIIWLRSIESPLLSSLAISWTFCVAAYLFLLIPCLLLGIAQPHTKPISIAVTTIWIISGVITNMVFRAI
jgi:hypothetical protein